MLSAVAARKARLQAQAPAQKPLLPQPTQRIPQSPSPQPEDLSDHAKPPSKRKSFEPAPKQSRKKRKVNKPAEKRKPSRYFMEKDSFKEQDDVIVVEEDDDESESSSSSDSGESSGELFSLPTVAVPPKRRRAWSPSQPIVAVESSEDEAEDAALEEIGLGVLPIVRAAEPDAPQVLSTYRPVPEQNFFDLSSEELASLGLSSASGKLLVLQLPDRVALLGTYSITVLQGEVRLNGTKLTPSLYAHSVFAPRSSPLPVIECSPSSSPSEQAVVQLSTRFAASASRGPVVIVLQELRTGVEGLGLVCKTFEDVFQPSRWQRNQTNVSLGLDGVHYVSKCALLCLKSH